MAIARVARVRDLSLHLTAVALAGGICLAGAQDTVLGLGLLVAFALLASLRALFRSLPMIFLILIAAGLALVIPVLWPIPIIIGIFFFFRRLSFFIDNFRVIALGILFYCCMVLLIVNGPALSASAIDAAGYRSLPVTPLVATFCAGALMMHLVLWLTNSWGYTTRHALEVLSVTPLLLVTLLLPFIKMTIDVATPDMLVEHGGFADAPAFAPETAAGLSAASLDHAVAVQPHVFDTVPHHIATPLDSVPSNSVPVVPDPPVAPLFMARGIPTEAHVVAFPEHMDSVVTHSPTVHPDTFVRTPTGFTEFQVRSFGSEQQIVDPQGFVEGVLRPFGNSVQHVTPSGALQHTVTPLGSGESVVANCYGLTEFKLSSFGDRLTLSDVNGAPLYYASQLGSKVQIHSPDGLVVREWVGPKGGYEMFRGLPKVT